MVSGPEQVFVARQPILDRDRNLVAYELLFRGSRSAGSAEFVDGTLATARVAIDAIFGMGISTVLGPHRGFINVDLEMLASEAIEALPPERFVLEVLESVPGWAVARCLELHERGFELALDDFVPDDDRSELLSASRYVKVDLIQTDREELPELARALRARGVSLLAEKVESPEEFERCKALDFELFQGFFFSRPATFKGTQARPERNGLLGAFRAIVDDRPLGELADVFKRHARLGVQLLRIANSAALGSRQRITAIEHAIMYVGREQLRRWVLLLLYASDGPDGAAHPALELAAVRGRLIELLAPMLERRANATEELGDLGFLAGMLSLADVILDKKLGDLFDELSVHEAVRTAVLERRGPIGQLLCIAEALEEGRFPELASALEACGLGVEHLAHAQREAYLWVRQACHPDAANEVG